MQCKVCAKPAPPFGAATVLGRHAVHYFRCERCGFIQTEAPFWLEEAYSSAMTRSDLGLAGRNVAMAQVTEAVLLAFFDPNARFVDYGGGYGLLVRLMRDRGFDYYRSEKYAANLFAQGFDAPPGEYALLTAFEVFEHLVEPRAEIEQMRAWSSSLLFSTVLVPDPPPPLDAWWYYGLDHGQHVALYTRRSLEIVAAELGLRLISNGRNVHLLTDRRMPAPAFAAWIAAARVAPGLSRLLRLRLKRRSWLPDDYYALTGRHLK